MSETRLRQYLLKNIDDQGHFCRIEAHDSQPGVPDLCYTIRGFNGWMELKYGDAKKPPHLRMMQWVWLRRNVQSGGNPLIFCSIVGKEHTRFGLIHGSKHDQIYKKPGLAPWVGAMDRYWDDTVDWAEFLDILRRPHTLTRG